MKALATGPEFWFILGFLTMFFLSLLIYFGHLKKKEPPKNEGTGDGGAVWEYDHRYVPYDKREYNVEENAEGFSTMLAFMLGGFAFFVIMIGMNLRGHLDPKNQLETIAALFIYIALIYVFFEIVMPFARRRMAKFKKKGKEDRE